MDKYAGCPQVFERLYVEGGLVFTRKVPRRLELGLRGYIGQAPGVGCRGRAMSSLLAGMCWEPPVAMLYGDAGFEPSATLR